MANSRKNTSPARLALADDRRNEARSGEDQAALDARLAVSNTSQRAREQAKKDVSDRNEQAHKKAVRQIADRDRLRRDMRKGLEF
jgi:hypothetical protein